MRPRVVHAITLYAFWTLSRSARLACDGGNGIDQGQQLRHIVRIDAGQHGREGNAVGVGDEVALAAGFVAIGGVGTRFFPPCTACTDDESTMARDQSTWSACCSLAKSTAWIRF